MRLLFFLLFITSFSFLSSQTKKKPVLEFINTLTKEQKVKAVLDFNNEKKTKWHYLPHSSFAREGISIKELQPLQRKLLNTLLKSSLSASGYNTTLKIMDLENVLAELSNDYIYRDSKKYYITFYGNPEKDKLWAWSFEGHHVSLNFTVFKEETYLAPRFFGANPGVILQGKRKGERLFITEEDLGLELITSMTPEQQNKAIINASAYPDIISKNNSKVSPLKTEGIPFLDLNKQQQSLLINLIYTHLSDRIKERSIKIMAKIKAEELESVYFGWAGETSIKKPHYYRIQGKTFLIELDNTQNNANHIHIVWRDFDGDFGRDLIQKHYETSHHH